MAEGVQHKLNPPGDAEFVENTKQVVFDGVLAEPELTRDFTVGEPLCYAGYNFFFPSTEEALTLGIHNVQRGDLAKGFQDELQFRGIRPDLAFVHAVNALA